MEPVPFDLVGLALKMNPSEGKLLYDFLEDDAIVPLRKVMARLVTLENMTLDRVGATREEVDMARGARKALAFLDDVLCEHVPRAYQAMIDTLKAREEAEDGGSDASDGRRSLDGDGADEPGPE